MKQMRKFMAAKKESTFSPKEGEFVLTEAVWEDNTPWKFIVSREKPNEQLCTAAFCVTSHRGSLLLARHKKRGWEFPGGHIDEGEGLDQALTREVMEETGAVIANPQMFGYKIVLPASPIPHRDKKGSFYPFPHSYIPYYFSEASELLHVRLAADILDIKLVNFEQAKDMLAQGHNHGRILEYVIKSKLVSIHE